MAVTLQETAVGRKTGGGGVSLEGALTDHGRETFVMTRWHVSVTCGEKQALRDRFFVRYFSLPIPTEAITISIQAKKLRVGCRRGNALGQIVLTEGSSAMRAGR